MNPYEPPRAELDVAPATGVLAPSLQDAIAGRYDFNVGDVMDEAWRLVKGMKATFWGAAIVVGLIYLVFNAVAALILPTSSAPLPASREADLQRSRRRVDDAAHDGDADDVRPPRPRRPDLVRDGVQLLSARRHRHRGALGLLILGFWGWRCSSFPASIFWSPTR